MGTWSISPSTGVTNVGNGKFVFDRHETDETYTITYTNGDCTTSTEYTVTHCDPTFNCSCSNSSFRVTQPSVTLDSSEGSTTSVTYVILDECYNQVEVGQIGYDGSEEWLNVEAVQSQNPSERVFNITTLSQNPSTTQERSATVNFKVNGNQCRGNLIVKQSPKPLEPQTYKLSSPLSVSVYPQGMWTCNQPIYNNIYVNLYVKYDGNDTSVTVDSGRNVIYNGITYAFDNILPPGNPCGSSTYPMTNTVSWNDLNDNPLIINCLPTEISKYRVEIKFVSSSNPARGSDDGCCTTEIVMNSISVSNFNQQISGGIFSSTLNEFNTEGTISFSVPFKVL